MIVFWNLVNDVVKVIGFVCGVFTLSFLGLVSVVAPKFSDEMFEALCRWVDSDE